MWVDKLLYLDRIKSSDFQEFSVKLNELTADENQLSGFEQEYLTLLKAYSAVYEGNTQQALSILMPLIEQADTVISFRAKALAINSLVLVRRYLDAFVYLEQLIIQLDMVSQPEAREQGMRVIALMYNLIGKYDLSLSYIDQLINEKPSSNAVCAAHQLRAEALYLSGRTDDFQLKSAEGLTYCTERNEPLWANIIVALIARHKIDLNDYQGAISLLLSHNNQVESTRYYSLILKFDSVLAQAYYGLGQVDLAKEHAIKVTDALKQDRSSLVAAETFAVLHQIAKTEKDYQQALEYHEQYTAAFTAYMDDKSAQQMAYHTAHSEILAQNQKIALLDKDNQLLQYEQTALKHQATFNKLLIVALVALVLGLAFMAYRSFVARQRFKALAEYDDLTAISNRYHFSASAKEALALCEKGQLPAALIVFDLDHFKQINDQYGHAAGDWALRQTVDTCRNFMRNNDVFGRIGGEEFAILLPGCQSDKAHLLADICRDAISNIDTAVSGYEFQLSASFGVTSAQISGYHFTKLIEDADTAMYQAKQQGRNKVQFFQG
ncbi:GGDEF domain-containing protein [Rheinheimera sp. 1928-s]|uniref:GGDEF domain-containing protein n=1 Tax=Rheinheimera sp. 1928-s TaxID=3033803 RepID=UPI0026117FE0|nr:GGDEF domain-containing protein [Rheinheimera sp. 1928-s]MDF3126997.1 GGDEF domain-containing protein [Rheinheimera sp. 1928-s]